MATPATKKTLNAKQRIIKQSAEQRNNAQRLAFAWQEKIFSKPKVSLHLLQQAAAVLQPQTYDEIVEERAVQDWCGYPLCDRQPLKDQPRYKISLSQRKVFDQSELSSFCSEDCMQKSKYFRMQLSEEPVWIRDSQRTPDIHIVLPSQNLKKALAKEKERSSKSKSGQQIRRDYVQHLLANVPMMATQSGQDLRIIEHENQAAPAAMPTEGIHDSIEGYRINTTKDRSQPTTMILKLKEEKEEEEKPLDLDNEEAVFEDAMETMMRLRNMQIDDTAPKTTADTKPAPTAKTTANAPAATATTGPRSGATSPKSQTPANETTTKTKTVTVVLPDQSKASEKKKKNKKKSQPEMSLFGKIWTMTDRITTRATRRYFQQLKEVGHISVRELIKDEEAKDDAAYMRSQIFSERILESYALLRAQLGLKHALENDLIDLIQTFRFADASMVVLDSLQAYMMTLVLFKALADITISEKDWHPKFDECCHSIGESRDTIDACVRVLKIAST